MKILHKKSLLVLGVVAAFVMGVSVTAVTFATIPGSTNKVISACRDTSTGSLRVIDAEANETCNSGEVSLTWSGAQSAIAAFSTDSLGQPSFNSTGSRDISDIKAGTYDDGNGGVVEGFCLHLDFTPKFISPDPQYSSLRDSDVAIIASACGSGYEFFTAAYATSFFFSE